MATPDGKNSGNEFNLGSDQREIIITSITSTTINWKLPIWPNRLKKIPQRAEIKQNVEGKNTKIYE